VVIAVVVVVVMVVVVVVVVVVIVMVVVVLFSSPSLSPAIAVLVVGLRPLVPLLSVLVSACPVPWFCCHGSTSFSSQLLTAMGCGWPSLSVPRCPAPLSLSSAVVGCPDPLSTPRTGVRSGGVWVSVNLKKQTKTVVENKERNLKKKIT
jgi:hypothetical protein